MADPHHPDQDDHPERPERPERPVEPPESVPPVSAEPPPEADEPRRYPSTIGGAFYLLVLGVVGASLVVVALDEWRTGVRLMGGALLFAAAVRLVLRRRDAGMLAVRHKVLDAAVLVVLGVSLIFLAGSIPDQPGGF